MNSQEHSYELKNTHNTKIIFLSVKIRGDESGYQHRNFTMLKLALKHHKNPQNPIWPKNPFLTMCSNFNAFS